MMKIARAMTAFALSGLPLAAAADFTVIQDSCQTVGGYPIAYFSVENHGFPMPVCTVSLLPHNNPSCFLVQCGAPGGWSCYPGDATTFYFADPSPDECVMEGEAKHGFNAELSADFCCFGAAFFANDGSYLGSEDVCFDCHRIGIRFETWGNVKQLFR